MDRDYVVLGDKEFDSLSVLAEYARKLEHRIDELETVPPIQAAARMIVDAVLRLIEQDNHTFQDRPCPTCRSITALVGREFGCDVKYAASLQKEVQKR